MESIAIAMRTRAAAAILAGSAIVAVAMWRRRRRRIVGVTVFARHGARAPNNGEMKVFSKDSAARLQWHHDDGRPPDYEASNNLTDVGRDQMRAVGRWLAQHPKYGPLVRSSTELAWHSSAAERCMESGKLIGEGLLAALASDATPAWPAAPKTYKPDMVFKAWDVKGTAYKKYVSDLPKDAAFAARASRVYPALRAMYAKIGGADVGEADTLLWSTYVHLMCECEQYSDRSLPGGRKAAVSTALSAAERHAIEAEACWVWERRFQGCEEHAAFLGAQLWARLAEPASGVAIFSGHDYSILALLSHLGVRTYAPPALGYASLVLVERRADGSARVLLNPQPFRDARTGEVVTSVSAGHEVAVAEVASNGELTLLV